VEIAVALREILEAINLKLGARDLACPLCQGTRWMPPTLTAEMEVTFASPTATLAPTGRVLPMATLCCDQCGYAVALNLIQLGLWNKWQAQSQLIIPSGANGKAHLPSPPGG
jgi:hypothetical protein